MRTEFASAVRDTYSASAKRKASLHRFPNARLPVVVKAAGPDADEYVIATVRNEQARLACYSHPGIVSLLPLPPQWEDGLPAIAMEYLAGGTLAERLTQQGVSVREGIEIGRFLAETLVYLHQSGDVHLDLKPSNIIFHNERPVLIDFGLAADIGASVPTAGTPAYASPERFGNGDVADDKDRMIARPAMDIYALGMTLHLLLTGRLHKPSVSLPPSSHNPLIPPQLDRLLLAMLAQRSQERPLADEVQATLNQICQLLDTPNRGAQRLLLGLLMLAMGITAVFLLANFFCP